MSDELPRGWVATTIDRVCGEVSKRGPDAERGKFHYIDLGAIDNKEKKIAEATEVDLREAPSRARQIVRKGDVLFSNVRVYLENIAMVPNDLDGEVASTAFCVLRPRDIVEARYLYYFVTSRSFINAVSKLQRGNSPPSVQDGDVKSQPFLLAPLPEQKRIASSIDELFSRIDEGERALERVQTLVERYRQSVLKAAVTGELTRAWREQRKGKLESGEALLARILKARRAAWEKAELEKMKAKGIKPANDAWKNKYKEPALPDAHGLPELPEGWSWCSGAHIFQWSSGDFLPAKSMKNGGIPVYGGNGINGQHDAWNVDFKTIVIGRVGVHCGNVHLTEDKSWVTDNAIYATEVSEHAFLGYCAIFLSSTRLGDFSQGGAQPFVNQKILNEIEIPLPPFEEQRAIVDYVLSEFSRLDDVSSVVLHESSRSTGLRQCILNAAFSGKLVAQVAEDEPALGLLERISDERQSQPVATISRKRSTVFGRKPGRKPK